jgi:hypothetical protein
MDPTTGLYDVEKRKYLTLPKLELRPLSHPAHILSLYQLRYPGSWRRIVVNLLITNLALNSNDVNDEDDGDEK